MTASVDLQAVVPSVQALEMAYLQRLLALEARQAWRDKFSLGADWNSSIQTTLDDAKSKGVPEVALTPKVTYPTTDFPRIPAGITLNGYGSEPYAEYGAVIKPANSAEAVVDFVGGHNALKNCIIDCNYKALVGVRAVLNHNTIKLTNLRIVHVPAGGTAVKLGGILYITMDGIKVETCLGWGLDARRTYSVDPVAAYYGMTVSESRNCKWVGAQGAMWVEGKANISYLDDFEMSTFAGTEGVVHVGGGVSTTLTMVSPYFEVGGLYGIIVDGSGFLTLQGTPEINGNHTPNSAGIYLHSAMGINTAGSILCINRYKKGFTGYVGAKAYYNIQGWVAGAGVVTANDVWNLENAQVIENKNPMIAAA